MLKIRSVIDALEHFAKVKHEKDRLDILVDSLSKEAEIPLKVTPKGRIDVYVTDCKSYTY